MKLGRHEDRTKLGAGTVGGKYGAGCGGMSCGNIMRGGKNPFAKKQKGGNYYEVVPELGGMLGGPAAGPMVVKGGQNCGQNSDLNMKAAKQHAPLMKGGNYTYKATAAGYGFKGATHEEAGALRGSYAPVSDENTRSGCPSQTGGAKRKGKKHAKKSAKKHMKKHAKKSAKKPAKKHMKKTAKKHMKKHAKKTAGKRKMKGGMYYQYGTNVADTPYYSVPGSVLPGGADANGSRVRHMRGEQQTHK